MTMTTKRYVLPTALNREWAKNTYGQMTPGQMLATDFATDVCIKMTKMGVPTAICHMTYSKTYTKAFLSTEDHVVLFRVAYSEMTGVFTLTSPYYAVKERGDRSTIESENPRYILSRLNKFSASVVARARKEQSPVNVLETVASNARKKCFTEEVVDSVKVNAHSLSRLLRVMNGEPRSVMTVEDETKMQAWANYTSSNDAKRERNYARLNDVFYCPKWVLAKNIMTDLVTVSALRLQVVGQTTDYTHEVLLQPQLFEDIAHFREVHGDEIGEQLEVALNMAKTNTLAKHGHLGLIDYWGSLMTMPVSATSAEHITNTNIGLVAHCDDNVLYYVIDKAGE
jgi:hypothetical protein